EISCSLVGSEMCIRDRISNLASLEALDVMMLIAEQHDISLTVIWTLAKSWMELSPSMGRA
ncbi:hypothetical protein ACO0TY_30530, partial [Klebsiella pneumoniae]